jgi:capsular polysaccharide biosynthesis protein
MALGTLLGLIFSVGLALAAEALGRRVRIEEDLSEAIGVPVLTSL